MNNKRKNALIMIACALSGALLGAVSKAADVAVQGNFLGNIFYRFGMLTTGFLIWCVIGFYIASHTKGLKQSVINNLCFFLSMLAAYYLYSCFIVKYYSMKVIVFWFIMTFAVAAATVVIKKAGNKKNFFETLYHSCGGFCTGGYSVHRGL